MDLSKIRKKIRLALRKNRINRRCKKEADKIISAVEKEKGRLSKSVKMQCDDYSAEVLGSRDYSQWLYVYSLVSGGFREGWIPDNYFGNIVMPTINGEYRCLSGFNSLTPNFFSRGPFPDVMFLVNGRFLSGKLECVDEKDVKKRLFAETDRVVFKLDNSFQGKGIFHFNEANFSIDKVKELGNGVFQSYIRQHDFFNGIVPSHVLTIRIITVYENNNTVSARSAILRVGRAHENHVMGSSTVRVPIDIETGNLSYFAFMPDWTTVEKHPDTRFVFRGRTIPNFHECVRVVSDLHRSIPQVMCIGWDLCVDNKNEVKIMEWNNGWPFIKFSEAASGPCFLGLGWEDLWRR